MGFADRRQIIVAIVIATGPLLGLSDHAQAQQYLGQMTAADCRSRGGSPDSSITDDANPDPPRGCWKHFTSGSAAGSSGSTTTTTTTTVTTTSGGGDNTAAVALQVGGAALNLLGQIIEAFGDDQPATTPAETASMAEVEAIKAQEAAVLAEEARNLNEAGRQAAADGKTVVALAKFQRALDTAEQINANENMGLYRDHMNTMQAYIAYDFGLRSWRSGNYEGARKRFDEAIHFAWLANKDDLAREITNGIKKLPKKGSADTNTNQGNGICMQINGEIVCE